MRTLIDLTKDKERVFVVLKTPHAKAEFLKLCDAEGFMLGNKLASACECDKVMIIHPDYTVCYCVGMATTMCYHHSEKVDFEKYISGADEYIYIKE